MAAAYAKSKSRKVGRSFVAVPHAILRHPNYASLKPRAVKLLFDLYGQYNGFNNGDFSAAFSIMKKLGWTSKDQLFKAREELLQKGWVVVTRQGGLNRATLFAVTFQSIDECKGKLDRKAGNKALGYWKEGHNPEY